jgi:superfamily II DNA or RNA helicase
MLLILKITSKPTPTLLNNSTMSILTEQAKSKLLPYQVKHAETLCSILLTKCRALDLSQTGTGKSYVSAAICASLNLRPLIISPKSLITMWPRVLQEYGVKPYGVANYEMIQNGKYMVEGKQETCPFIKEVGVPRSDKDTIVNEYKSKKDSTDQFVSYKWSDIPDDMILIFDEAHRCKNPRTYNSMLLHTAAETKMKILLLSATLADKPETFILPAFVLGLANTCQGAKHWLSKLRHEYESIMAGVHHKIYPDFASRMKVRDAEVQNLFPDNKIMANCYEMENAEEIEAQYDLIEKEMIKLRDKESRANNVLSRILYARMRIEQLKVPTFVKIAKQELNKGKSVALFVNFNETMNTLMSELNTTCVIKGSQTNKQRDISIDKFNQDLERVIICNIQSGGVGISLHDTIGNHARVSIISPTWSAQDILQVLGRVYRANAKTPVEQKIIFCQGTIEEQICKNMSRKITNIAQLNDGDLLSHKIEGLEQPEHDTTILSEPRKIKMEEEADVDDLVEKMTTTSISKKKSKSKKSEPPAPVHVLPVPPTAPVPVLAPTKAKKSKKSEKESKPVKEVTKKKTTESEEKRKNKLAEKRKKLLAELKETESQLSTIM